MRVVWWLVQIVCLAFGLSASPVALAQRDGPSVAKGLTVPAADPPPREKPDASRPRSLTYDSRTCSRDAEGMVYFAIHRRVFRQPARNISYINGREPEYMRRLPIPPKPEEPEGCPDHPIQADVFHLSQVSTLPDGPAARVDSRADLISVVVNGGTVPITDEGTFDQLCKTFTLHDNSNLGWIGCTRPTTPVDSVFRTTEYLASESRKISVICRAGLTGTQQPTICEGGYRLHVDMVVNFKFSQNVLPVSEFIAADRELRRRFDAAEVKNYPWATPPDSNETRRE